MDDGLTTFLLFLAPMLFTGNSAQSGTQTTTPNPPNTNPSGGFVPYTAQNTSTNEALYYNNLGGIIHTNTPWTIFNEKPNSSPWKAFATLTDGERALMYNLLYRISVDGTNASNVYAKWVGNNFYTCALTKSGITTLNRSNVASFALAIARCENSKVNNIVSVSQRSFENAYSFVVNNFPNLAL